MPKRRNGASRKCSVWISLAMAYIEMPEEKIVMVAKEMAFSPRVFSSKRSRKYSGTERARAIIERHHKDAHEHHGRDGADPVKMTREDAVLCAGCAHADDFLRAQVIGDKRQAADPRGNRAAGEEKIRAGLHVALEGCTDAKDEREVHGHDDPVDGGQSHSCASPDRKSVV